MKAETVKPSTKKLRPDAPAFVPFQKILENLLLYQQLQAAEKEPQCSRYSRKSVRVSLDSGSPPEQDENINSDATSGPSSPSSPRPILGTKTVSPRAILGRKENLMPANPVARKPKIQPESKVPEKVKKDEEEDDDDGLANMGKEYRSVYRRIQRLKMSDEANKKSAVNINSTIQLCPMQANVWTLFPRECVRGGLH